MKKYEKTQAKLNKFAAVLALIGFTFNAVSLEYSDLSWNTNKVIYRNLFLMFAILVAMYLDYKHWFRKPVEK